MKFTSLEFFIPFSTQNENRPVSPFVTLGTVATRMVPVNQLQVGHFMFIAQRYTRGREPFTVYVNLLGTFLRKVGNQSKRQLCKEKS